MLNAVADGQNHKAAEYLELLRSLSAELDHAIEAITTNALLDLEESIANQYLLSARIIDAAQDLRAPLPPSAGAPHARADVEIMRQIHSAARRLQSINQHYAALLQYSSRSGALMASVFSSVQGEYQEGSGRRVQPNLSCDI